MNHIRLPLFAILAAVSALLSAPPAGAADARNGEQLAQRWCAACHVVQSAQRTASADAPPFEEMAKRPTFTENGLATFLISTHQKMPDMNLTRAEAADIAAYIGSLK